MNILLCNDTGTKAHIGCQGVSDAHARLLGRAGHRVSHRIFVNALRAHVGRTLAETTANLERDDDLMAHLEAADVVIVNGEGTLHHNNGLEYLALLGLAQRQGKATLLVNALYQEMAVETDVLSRLDAFYVRDPRSKAYVESLGLSCAYAPDSIIAAGFDAAGREDFTDQVLVTDWVKARDDDVGATLTRYLGDAPHDAPPAFLALHALRARVTWRQAVADVASARAVVSARYHGLYLSVLAGVPFVPMASNSWKMDAFLEAWELPFTPCADLGTLRDRLGSVEEARPAVARARGRLLERRDLPIFEVLGQGDGPADETGEVARLRSQIAAQDAAIAADKRMIAKRRLREARAVVDLATFGTLPAPRGLWRFLGRVR